MRRIFAAVTALALAACATPEDSVQQANVAPAGRDCFISDNVSGYSYVDGRHINVTVGAGRIYVLTTMFNARDLDWTNAIAIRSSSHWICIGNGLGVEIIGGDPQRNYPITAIERATEADPAPEGS